MCSFLESELATVRQEKESLTQQLLNTIKHKVALSQELDAWQVWWCVFQQFSCSLLLTGSLVVLQEDMRLVINQQVLQREEERKRESQQEKEVAGGLQRSKSLRVKGETGKGFFSFFKDK